MSDREKKISDNIATLKAKSKNEPVASFLKMDLLELAPGYSRVAMRVLPEHQNFNGLTFGGMVMAVADQAFAYGCNSLMFPSYASQINIHFIAAAEVGDELIAECRVVKSGRRVGLSEMTVTNQDGKLIAKATGTSIPVDKP
ncbi:MAG: PaaI family thioesterase [Chloroflexi bacterium]|nr:PaaI family thioesterase [Chloroflexota bacterium]